MFEENHYVQTSSVKCDLLKLYDLLEVSCFKILIVSISQYSVSMPSSNFTLPYSSLGSTWETSVFGWDR